MGGWREDLERDIGASRWEGGGRGRVGQCMEKLGDACRGLEDGWRGCGRVDGGVWKRNGDRCFGGGNIRW